MATIVSALNTEFTPAAGDFIVQVTSGQATLLRKNAAGAAFAQVQPGIVGAYVCNNPVAGAVYKLTSDYPATAVQADQ